LKQLLCALFVARLAVTRTPIVWTVHNAEPHERLDAIDRLLYRWFTEHAARRIHLTEFAREDIGEPSDEVIVHGDYRPVVGSLTSAASQPVSGRLLLFGLLRPYKGIEHLIAAVDELRPTHPEIHLRVAGRPITEEFHRELEAAADAVPGVELVARRLDDPELVGEIESAQAVVLPYRQIHNSGAALYGLSVGRPIVATRSASMEELQAEVGRAWIALVDHPITHESLANALGQLAGVGRDAQPDLSRRDWGEIGRLHARLYRSLTERP
jgi:beta-1,4-mannosyltransferase